MLQTSIRSIFFETFWSKLALALSYRISNRANGKLAEQDGKTLRAKSFDTSFASCFTSDRDCCNRPAAHANGRFGELQDLADRRKILVRKISTMVALKPIAIPIWESFD